MLNIAANETKQFVALCELIGRPDLPHDARFSERNTRKRYRAELKHEIEAALAADTASNWEQRMTAAGVPAGLVLSVPEAISQPQLVGRDFVHELQDGDTVQRVTRAGFRFADAQGESSSGAPISRAPHLSEHTDAHLQRLGFDASAIARLREDGAI
jgi:CoA:oxalate CoA-transferase